MKVLCITAAAAFASLLLSSPASADVKLSLHDGRVTIVAHDATVRQILAEWARVGQINIVNLERIPGAPQTIELTNVPEAEALDLLLRSISGFIAAPRQTPASATASQFDRIVVMPTMAAPKPPASAATAPVPSMFPQPMQPPQPTDDDVDDERPAPPVAVPPGTPRPPIFNQLPQPQVVPAQVPQAYPQQPGAAQPFNPAQVPFAQPQQPQQQPTATPSAPFGGVAVPGMVAPAPQQQPGQPTPTQPRRPGGDIEGH
jgi:hypothetical protein